LVRRAWWATTSPTWSPLWKHDAGPSRRLTDYIHARQGYDYEHHGRAGNPSTDFVPDEVIDRFCILGTPEEHIEQLEELRDLGVDQFGIYLMHDDQEGTLEAYGREIIPALN
jgi:alkanesulfonate monooxygenase SsuD/methylene tetrahydromethanopterin reductase-like flavin-dependent oxidoreductase (luciferase family)